MCNRMPKYKLELSLYHVSRCPPVQRPGRYRKPAELHLFPNSDDFRAMESFIPIDINFTRQNITKMYANKCGQKLNDLNPLLAHNMC
jgi:hypothetical protein